MGKLRSRSGCLTCRARKVRCDGLEQSDRTSCNRCCRLRLQCISSNKLSLSQPKRDAMIAIAARSQDITQAGFSRIRSAESCDFCRSRRQKCSGEDPCARCLKSNRPCGYSTSSNPGGQSAPQSPDVAIKMSQLQLAKRSYSSDTSSPDKEHLFDSFVHDVAQSVERDSLSELRQHHFVITTAENGAVGSKDVKDTLGKRGRKPKNTSLVQDHGNTFAHNTWSDQIERGLDSLVIPFDAPPRDQRLIRWFLRDGQRLMLGTTEAALCDPQSDMAYRQLPTCSVYVLTKIVISEHFLCIITRKEPTVNFFKTRAAAYNATKLLVSNPESTTHSKLAALHNLHWMDFILDCQSAQASHLQALDRILSLNCGIQTLVMQGKDKPLLVRPTYLLGAYLTTPFRFQHPRLLKATLSNFMSSLREIQTLTAALSSQQRLLQSRTRTSSASSTTNSPKPALQQLSRYLMILTNNVILGEKAAPHSQIGRTFGLLFNICQSLVELRCDYVMSLRFLSDLQRQLDGSVALGMSPVWAKTEFEYEGLHPTTLILILHHIRENFSVGDAWQVGHPYLSTQREINICSSTVDMLKLLSHLSDRGKSTLMKVLLDCLMTVIEDGYEQRVSENELESLRNGVSVPNQMLS